MEGYKLAGEDENSFTIHGADGGPFKVAKLGLDESTTSKIQGMPKAQGYAEGGVVEKASDKADKIRADMDRYLTVANTGYTPEKLDQMALEPEDTRTIEEKGRDLANSMHDSFFGKTERAPSSEAVTTTAQPQAAQTPLMGPMPEVAGPPAPAAVTDQLYPQGGAQGQAAPGAQPVAAPGGMDFSNPYGMMMGAYGDMAKAIRAGAGAQAAQGRALEAANAQFLEQQKALTEQYKTKYETLEQEQAKLVEDYKGGKIDPNRVWSNTSTGNKVIAGIGMLLSGIGSGMTGQPNMAMQVIDKTIERDIEAQKANLGKTESLLNLNMKRFGNLREAETATRMQMNSALQAQIQMAAARAGSQQAQAVMLEKLAELKLKGGEMARQMAMYQVESKMMGAGGDGAGIPVGSEPTWMLTDPKHLAVRVVANGKVYRASTPEAAAQLNKQGAAAEEVLYLVRELSALGKSAMIPGTPEADRAAGLRAKLGTAIPQMSGLGRLNETEIHQAADMVTNPSKFKTLLTGDAKNQQFFKMVEHELESNRKQFIPNYKGSLDFKTFKRAGE